MLAPEPAPCSSLRTSDTFLLVQPPSLVSVEGRFAKSSELPISLNLALIGAGLATGLLIAGSVVAEGGQLAKSPGFPKSLNLKDPEKWCVNYELITVLLKSRVDKI